MATNFEVLGLPGGDIQYEYNRSFYALFATAGSGGDGSPPVVSLNFPLNQAVEGQASIGIDVTDVGGNLGRVIITARIEAFGIEEVVFQGDRFAPAYAARSTRVAIANGFRYTISRSAGWPGSPSIDVYAVDAAGSEA